MCEHCRFSVQIEYLGAYTTYDMDTETAEAACLLALEKFLDYLKERGVKSPCEARARVFDTKTGELINGW